MEEPWLTQDLGRPGAALGAAACISPPRLRSRRRPPPRPPAPQYPPTATITTPGYPALGPADSKSARRRACRTARRVHLLAGDARDHTVGLVRQCPAARAPRPFRRHHRHGNDDAQPQPGGSRARPSSRSRSCAPISPAVDLHTLTGPIYIEGGRARRRAQGDAEQDRAARLCNELQCPGHCSASSRTSIRTVRSNISISTSTRMTTEFLPGVVLPLRPFPGTLGSRAQGARPLFERAARRIRRQHGHS